MKWWKIWRINKRWRVYRYWIRWEIYIPIVIVQLDRFGKSKAASCSVVENETVAASVAQSGGTASWCGVCVCALVGLCVFVLIQWTRSLQGLLYKLRGDYSLPAFFFSLPPFIYFWFIYIPKLPSAHISSPFPFKKFLSSLSPSLSSHPHPHWVSHWFRERYL